MEADSAFLLPGAVCLADSHGDPVPLRNFHFVHQMGRNRDGIHPDRVCQLRQGIQYQQILALPSADRDIYHRHRGAEQCDGSDPGPAADQLPEGQKRLPHGHLCPQCGGRCGHGLYLAVYLQLRLHPDRAVHGYSGPVHLHALRPDRGHGGPGAGFLLAAVRLSHDHLCGGLHQCAGGAG